jgi:NAD(P)-dependent dehydrogenase (short-subunit alcohol dehydrogenase family)
MRASAALARMAAPAARRLLPARAAASAAASAPPPARIALVQGASRGLGLELVRQLLLRPDHAVVATCRAPAAAAALRALSAAHPGRLRLVRLDAADEASIAAAAAEVAELHQYLNLLINAAGVLHVPGVLKPETSLQRVTLAALRTTFETNAFGPILVAKAFQPLLEAAAAAAAGTSTSSSGASASSGAGAGAGAPSLSSLSDPDARPAALVASLSARVGSISDNRAGGWYSYRASKAALNQLHKTLAIELARRGRGVAAVLLHPGTADTELSRPWHAGVPEGKLFSRERAAAQLLGLLDGARLRDSGKFWAWDGSEISW